MEQSSNEVTIIDAYSALNDALDNICPYLKIKDLKNFSLVCKSWHKAARREISKRGPERVLIPHLYSKEIEDPEFHVYNLLNTEPYVSLLFIGPSLRERNHTTLEYEILCKYKNYFRHKLIAIGVDECIMDKKTIVSCPGMLGSPNGILGLCLPLYRDLQIKTITNAKKINQDLSLIDNQLKTTFIMFSNTFSRYDIPYKIIKIIKQRFPQKMYTLWGGIFDDVLKAIDCEDENFNEDRTDFILLYITGSSLQSWSAVVDCKIKRHEVDKILLNLRNNLKLKRHTIGLACGPRYFEDLSKSSYDNMYVNSHELMDAVKKIFPSIPFIGIFNYGYHGHFGVDSTSDDSNQQLVYQMSMTLMILTYD